MAQWAGFSDSRPPPPSAPLSLPTHSAHLGGNKEAEGGPEEQGGTTEEHGGGDGQLI